MRRTAFSLPAILAAFLLGLIFGGSGSRQAVTGEPGAEVSSVYYSRCAEARAAGVAPLYVGDPGYRKGLDADGDGIACEPYYN